METTLAAEAVTRRLDFGRVAISLAIVLVIATAVYLIEDRGGSSSTPVDGRAEGPGPKVGQVAPEIEGVTPDGTRVRLSDLRGKPVWINFWASWCPPCRAETPDIVAAVEANRDSGLVLLAVNLGETADAARRYAETSQINGIVVLDPGRAIAARYHINGIPTHQFVAPDGTLRRIFVGSINRELAAKYLAEILPR